MKITLTVNLSPDDASAFVADILKRYPEAQVQINTPDTPSIAVKSGPIAAASGTPTNTKPK